MLRFTIFLFMANLGFLSGSAIYFHALGDEQPLRIVGFGDSLMAGYQLDNDKSFPSILEKNLQAKGYHVEIINAGVSGDTTSAGLARLNWSIDERAQLVIMELGANDMLRGIDPALTKQNLDAILQQLKQRQIPVLLAGMKSAPNMGAEQMAAFDAIYPYLAQKYQIPLYPFFLDGVATNLDLLLSDGMHPNEEGVVVIATRFLPLIEQTLQQLGYNPKGS